MVYYSISSTLSIGRALKHPTKYNAVDRQEIHAKQTTLIELHTQKVFSDLAGIVSKAEKAQKDEYIFCGEM